jgi:hypothetical protein
MEYKGFSYTFDPEKQVMKDEGITELTPENRKTLAGKILEYQKVARHRAHVGAVLRWGRDQIENGKDISVETIISAFQEDQRHF